MTLKCTKVVKNMLGIGGTISVGAFCFSLASSKWNITKIHNLDYSKDLKIEPEKISSVNDIEDLEYQKGCKFLFYDKTKETNVFKEGSFWDARGASIKGLVESVKKNAEKCEKGSYIFIDSAAAAAEKK